MFSGKQGRLSIWQILILSGILILAGGLIAFKSISKIKAAESGDVDGVDLHIKMEVSSDNGATWHNYSGTESAGHETIIATPGSTIRVRFAIWNTGIVTALNVTGDGVVSNSSYIDTASVDNSDNDGNGTSYDGYFFAGGTTGDISQITPGSNEKLALSVKLKDDFPTGETIILGVGTLDDYNPQLLVGNSPFGLFGKAFAEGVGRSSSVRIAVNVAGETTENDQQASGSSGSDSNASDLPDTGRLPIIDLIAKYLP